MHAEVAMRPVGLRVKETSPMKRGLKWHTLVSGTLPASAVKESSPMKRGLKCIDDGLTQGLVFVKESSPMKRGLKLTYVEMKGWEHTS